MNKEKNVENDDVMKPFSETIRLVLAPSMRMKIALISMHDLWPKLAVFSFDASEIGHFKRYNESCPSLEPGLKLTVTGYGPSE